MVNNTGELSKMTKEFEVDLDSELGSLVDDYFDEQVNLSKTKNREPSEKK